MPALEDLKVGQHIRFTFLDDEKTNIKGEHNPDYGSVVRSQGKILEIDTRLFGGPYVVADDGKAIYLLDLAEVTEIISSP